jgi:hypothetical protein
MLDLGYPRLAVGCSVLARIWKAFERIIGAILLLGLHDVYQLVLGRSLGEDFAKISRFLNIVETAVFLVITAELLWEALRIFLPFPVDANLESGVEPAAPREDNESTEINR